MSGVWQVEAKKPISRPPMNAGVTTVMSLICPAVSHGSLVSSTSPSSSDSGGNALTKWRTPVAIALMWPGVPLRDWRIMFPALSNTPQARSSDSRTIVLKAVVTSVACCSSRIDSRRLEASPTTSGSSATASLMPRPPRGR